MHQAPSLVLCGLSLYGFLPLLRLLAALRPEYGDPALPGWPPPEGHFPATVPELTQARHLFATPHGCTAGPAFAPARPLADDALRRPGTATLCCDFFGPHSAAIFRRFDLALHVVQDVRDLLWSTSAVHLWASTGAWPSIAETNAFARYCRPTFLKLWNEHALGFLVDGGVPALRLVRLEDLATDLPAAASGLARDLGASLPPDLSWENLTAFPGRPPSLSLYTSTYASMDADLQSDCLDVCGPVLSLCGYGEEPGRLAAPQAWEPAPMEELIRDLLRTDRIRPTVANELLCRLAPDRARTVVNIPARSGSKRLRNKNIADVEGVPLLALTVRFAKSLPGVDLVVLNTDDPEYARIGREHGAATPFLRPRELATDSAPIGDATDLCLRRLVETQGIHVKKLLTMYPTTPFRNPATVLRMLDALDTHPIVTSCMRSDPHWADLRPAGEDHAPRPTTLESLRISPLPRVGLYKTTGCLTGLSFVHSGQGTRLFQLKNPFELIDVDTEQDLALVRRVARFPDALQGIAPCCTPS